MKKFETIFDIWNLPSILESINSFKPRVRDVLIDEMLSDIAYLVECLAVCESPIEELLLIALSRSENAAISKSDDGCYVINPQHEIKVSDKIYRVDFLICAVFLGRNRQVVVECDGHDFHERTKQQARKDKQRDRDLIQAGYEVIRFTGSEIYENPFICARQINDIVFKSG